MSKIISARNVNDAVFQLMQSLKMDEDWLPVSPRGQSTLEYNGTVITEYQKPNEYVLFNTTRDANPFFHFIESLWILAGSADVATLARFNSKMTQYSDDGKVFHAPYGYRMREHFAIEGSDESRTVDQLKEVINLLREEPDTRRAVICLWDPRVDTGSIARASGGKDIPCNDLIMFKLRNGVLNMTVCCRSNDALLGAYGANAVQFGVLLEFVAGAIGAEIGYYRQLSDSFHVYDETKLYATMMNGYAESLIGEVTYGMGVKSKGITSKFFKSYGYDEDTTVDEDLWLSEVRFFVENVGRDGMKSFDNRLFAYPFFRQVAIPIANAWEAYKQEGAPKNLRIELAVTTLNRCLADDWRVACMRWLLRRREVEAA